MKPRIYQMPDGTWACSYRCVISDGFKTRQGAKRWADSQALSGPVGINVARLLGIELPPVKEEKS